MAAIRSRSVTSAVRTCPSTIIRRAVAVSNMDSVPLIRRALCAAAPGKTQAFGKRKLCLRQLRRGGVKLRLRLSPVALPPQRRSFIERCIIRGPVATTPVPVQGHVAEWLRNGLQNRVPRFNSGRGLQTSLAQRSEGCPPKLYAKAGPASRPEPRPGKPGKTKANPPEFPSL